MPLVDLIKYILNATFIEKAAAQLNENKDNIRKTIDALLPVVMVGLSGCKSKKIIAASILKTQKNDLLDNLLNANSEFLPVTAILTSIFGEKLNGIIAVTSKFSGVRKSSASTLLDAIMAAAIAAAHRYADNEEFDSADLSMFLKEQNNSLRAPLPDGLSFEVLGLECFSKQGDDAAMLRDKKRRVKDKGRFMKWMLPAILILMLVWLCLDRCRAVPVSAMNFIEEIKSSISKEIPDSCIVYDSQNQAIQKTIYSCNDKNLPGIIANYSLNPENSRWMPIFTYAYGYDNDGNLLSATESKYDQTSGESSVVHRNNFTYSDKGCLTNQEFYSINSKTGLLSGVSRIGCSYNGLNCPESVIQYSGTTSSGEWMPAVKYLYGYDSDTVQNSVETYRYDSINQNWLKETKWVKTSNASGQPESEENYISESNDWKKYSKTQNLYENQLLMQSTVYFGANNQWEPATKTVFKYGNNRLTSKISTSYDPKDASWTNAFKDSIEYLPNGKISRSLSFIRNTKTNEWVQVNKTIYDYADGEDIQKLVCTPNGKWTGIERTHSKYDDTGQKTMDEKYLWDDVRETWLPLSKTEQAYDSSIGKLTFSAQYSLANDYSWEGHRKQEFQYTTLDNGSPALEYFFTYAYAGSGWNLSGHKRYFYTKDVGTTGSNIQSDNPISVSWFSDKILIETFTAIEKSAVYFVDGKQVYTGKDTAIATTGWERGVYIVIVKMINGKTKSQKITVR